MQSIYYMLMLIKLTVHVFHLLNQLSSNLRHVRVFEMDVEDEEEEERADESQDISCDRDGLVETSTNQGGDGEVEACEEMGDGSGNILEQISGSGAL